MGAVSGIDTIMILARLFPRLTPQNHAITSPSTAIYNCIAWAAGDTTTWWQPGLYWPIPADPLDESLAVLTKVFEHLGYEVCLDDTVEPGFEKVALYSIGEIYTHAARQLSNGHWTSKLGNEEDIEHDSPSDVGGSIYGSVALVMKRKTAE